MKAQTAPFIAMAVALIISLTVSYPIDSVGLDRREAALDGTPMENGQYSGFAFKIAGPTDHIRTTPPLDMNPDLITRFTEEEADAVAEADGLYAMTGESPSSDFYHMFRFDLPAPSATLRWIGYADGGGQVMIWSWNGELWEGIFGYSRVTSAPEEVRREVRSVDSTVWVKVNCVNCKIDGRAYTDLLEILGPSHATTDGH